MSRESGTASRDGGGRFWWNRLKGVWRGVRWLAIGGLAALALVLGYASFDSYLGARGIVRSFWDKLYLSIQLFPLHSGAVEPPAPASLHVARLLAPAVTAYAAGSAILAIFRDQVARARVRWVARNHVVVCGLGRTGHLLTLGFRARGERVVAIEKDPSAPAIGECREAGATVLVGDATDEVLLPKTRVDRARHLFAVCGDDGANAKIAIDARALVRRRSGPPLACVVRILDVALAELLEAEMAARSGEGCRLEFFNPSERGAPALLNEHPPFDDHGCTPFGVPHLLVVGLGEMGSRLVLHAARRWRAVAEPGARLRVTVVDRVAESLVRSLSIRHEEPAGALELVPRQHDIDTPEFERAEFLLDPDGGRHVTGVYVCLDDDAKGIGAGLRLCRRLRGRKIPIVVRTKQHGGLGALVGDGTAACENLHVFGLLNLTCRPEVFLAGRTEILARAIHEEYVHKQTEDGATPETNPSMVPWEELPEHLKESNRRQADDIGAKLRAIGCEIEPVSGPASDSFRFAPHEVEHLARLEHDRWWKEREADGWTFAPEKDVTEKKSPYLVEWEELSEEIREYDRIAVRGIPAFLARAGFRVVRSREEEPHGGATGG